MFNNNLNKKTLILIKTVHEKGFNISMMFNLYKKRSKLSPEIPQEVIQEVCLEYLNKDPVNKSFPYFLTILKNKTEMHFANKNTQEGKRLKTAPWKVKVHLG